MGLPTGLAVQPGYPGNFGGFRGGVIDGAQSRLSYSLGAGVAGTYSLSLRQPGGSILLDCSLVAVALWNSGTSATGIVGDATDPNGIFDAINMKGTDLLATESISPYLAGGKAGADIANSQWNRRYSAADRDITLSIVTVGSTTTGETIFSISWYFPTRAEVAGTFVAT